MVVYQILKLYLNWPDPDVNGAERIELTGVTLMN